MPQFIAHIDEANMRVTALETELGVAHGEFIDNLDAVNARIQELEGKQSAPVPVASSSSSSTTTDDLGALNARCRYLANCLGFQEYGTQTSVPSAKARVADLEKRIQQSAQAHEQKQRQTPAAPQPKPLPNGLAAIEKSGKVFGLGKAMIAAHHQSQQPPKAPQKVSLPQAPAARPVGKLTGLDKAIAAATARNQQQ